MARRPGRNHTAAFKTKMALAAICGEYTLGELAQQNDVHRNQIKRWPNTANRRTAYSLRHTYTCLRLLEGVDIYQISKNYRTSVEMIEKYYAAHIKTNIDAAAINVRKSPNVGHTG